MPKTGIEKKYIVEWYEKTRFYVAIAAKDKIEAEQIAFTPYYYDHATKSESGIQDLEITEIKDEA